MVSGFTKYILNSFLFDKDNTHYFHHPRAIPMSNQTLNLIWIVQKILPKIGFSRVSRTFTAGLLNISNCNLQFY